MWNFTQNGFMSAVEFRGEPDYLLIRARVREDLEPLVERYADLEIIPTLKADYPFRVVMSKALYAAYMVTEILGIDYDNFKSRVLKNDGYAREWVYMRVWSAVHDLERLDKILPPKPKATAATFSNTWDINEYLALHGDDAAAGALAAEEDSLELEYAGMLSNGRHSYTRRGDDAVGAKRGKRRKKRGRRR